MISNCSKKLDFTISSKYNFKFLSFVNYENTDSSYRNKTCRINVSTSLKNIVEKITKCETRDSLEEVKIKYNQILKNIKFRLCLMNLEHLMSPC